jgi:triacylglycerol lipase
MTKVFFVVILAISVQISYVLAANDYADTKYPIVLVHGLFGYAKSPFLFHYWGEIPHLLRNFGAIVYEAEVSQAHKVKYRGEQLYQQLFNWGHAKYNIIGHSHGGLDARYVLENYPDIVASITTIGTPHHGSKVADAMFKNFTGHASIAGLIFIFGDILGHIIGALSGNLHEQNSFKALYGLTFKGAKKFNKKYPIGIGKKYCQGGISDYVGKKLYSFGSHGAHSNSSLDIMGKIFSKTSLIFNGEPNDGLVSVCSMKFGKWLGVLDGHHLVPLGGIILPIPEEQLLKGQEMLLVHANRLKKHGL